MHEAFHWFHVDGRIRIKITLLNRSSLVGAARLVQLRETNCFSSVSSDYARLAAVRQHYVYRPTII